MHGRGLKRAKAEIGLDQQISSRLFITAKYLRRRASDGFAFVNTLDAMERFLDAVGMANVKATVDISHFWLQRIPPADLSRRLEGRVAHVHVSDCDGIHHGDLPPGRGNTPFDDYLAAIRDTGFVGAASIELEFPDDPAAMLLWVREAHASTLRLLTGAGVH